METEAFLFSIVVISMMWPLPRGRSLSRGVGSRIIYCFLLTTDYLLIYIKGRIMAYLDMLDNVLLERPDAVDAIPVSGEV